MTTPDHTLSLAVQLQTLAVESGADVRVYACDVDGQAVVPAKGSSSDSTTVLAASAVALVREVERALLHLHLGGWNSIAVECAAGSLAIARRADGGRLTVAAGAMGTPVGLAGRVASRAAQLSEVPSR